MENTRCPTQDYSVIISWDFDRAGYHSAARVLRASRRVRRGPAELQRIETDSATPAGWRLGANTVRAYKAAGAAETDGRCVESLGRD